MSAPDDLTEKALDLCDRIIEVHANVQMDTPEDVAVHDMAVEVFRRAATELRREHEQAADAALAVVDTGLAEKAAKAIDEARDTFMRCTRTPSGHPIVSAYNVAREAALRALVRGDS